VPSPRPENQNTRIQLARSLAALLAASAVGCQSYEPRPLDLPAHRTAWHGRTLEAASLHAFVERLERAPGGDASFDPADGLTLREGRLVALVLNPRLRLARLRVAGKRAGAEHAGSWDDPELSLSALWITESVSDRWILNPGLTFSVPLSDRLDAEEDLADAEQRAEERRALEAEWAVCHDLGEAWAEWSAATLRVAETERLIEALEALTRTAAQLAEAGELARTEASLFVVEAAQRENQLVRLRGEVAAAEQRVRALLGLAPEAPVELVPSLAPLEVETTAVPDAIAARNPGLARLREEYEVAEETLRREVAKQIPDLTLGPQYESDEGQSRIGLVAGIPLPFLNANRRAIAEARAARELARAAFETEYEALVGRGAALAVRADTLARARADLEEGVVPLVDRQLEDALELARLGEGSSLVLLESLGRAHQTKLDLVETRLAETRVRAELEYVIGPPSSGGGAEAPVETP
jgi:outer membrane protein TolC